MDIRESIERLGKSREEGVLRDNKGKFVTSGNPKGRPIISLTDRLHNFYEQDLSRLDDIVFKLHETATNPNQRGYMPAVNTILERIDGKVPDRLMSINVKVTPEMLQQAQTELLSSQDDTKKLLQEYVDS